MALCYGFDDCDGHVHKGIVRKCSIFCVLTDVATEQVCLVLYLLWESLVKIIGNMSDQQG